MHIESLEKILDFYRQGGIVLATGTLPKASSRIGENDSGVEAILREIFGESRDPVHNKELSIHSNNAGRKGGYGSSAEIVSAIPKLITPDFIPGKDGGCVLHRKIDDRDVYMVTEVKHGSDMFFRATGRAERWNAEDGTIETLPVLE
ncbi:MAG: hypothetical protein LUD15_03125 [Bacteroides sp.]|nr:hypothetical protein [Bacteroides sp.]